MRGSDGLGGSMAGDGRGWLGTAWDRWEDPIDWTDRWIDGSDGCGRPGGDLGMTNLVGWIAWDVVLRDGIACDTIGDCRLDVLPRAGSSQRLNRLDGPSRRVDHLGGSY